jgi:hypothetical protein
MNSLRRNNLLQTKLLTCVVNLYRKNNIIFLFKTILQIMTPSLGNFLGSLFAGTFIVIIPITIALVLVSRLDPLARDGV